MPKTKTPLWAVLPLFLLLAMGSDVRAMSCAPGPLSEDLARADAVFTGRITAVRYRSWFEVSGLCRTHSDGPRCGEKVAQVRVDQVWKGEVGEETFVYSEDGCNCLGGYFSEGEERIFMVVRDDDWRIGLGGSDFRTAFCGRNTTVENARREGILDSLDKHFPTAQ